MITSSVVSCAGGPEDRRLHGQQDMRPMQPHVPCFDMITSSIVPCAGVPEDRRLHGEQDTCAMQPHLQRLQVLWLDGRSHEEV